LKNYEIIKKVPKNFCKGDYLLAKKSFKGNYCLTTFGICHIGVSNKAHDIKE
jgi:hypothetical protein